MARRYMAAYSGTITAAGGDTDLIEILPADDKPVRLIQLNIGQISEVGDAAEEGIRLTLLRLPATVTSGSGGSSITAGKVDSGDSAFSGAIEMNNTTVATTSSTAETLGEYGWNLRAPLELVWPDPDMRPVARQGEALVFRFQTTLADDATGQITAILEEI